MRQWITGLPLLWRVFLTNAVVLVVATMALALAPITVSVPVALTELVVLVAGMLLMLALDFALLRPAIRPLRTLSDAMRAIDPLEPGRRVPPIGEPDVA